MYAPCLARGWSPIRSRARLGENGAVVREQSPDESGDPKVLTKIETRFQPTGGLKMLTGNLAVRHQDFRCQAERHVIEAPANRLPRPAGVTGCYSSSVAN